MGLTLYAGERTSERANTPTNASAPARSQAAKFEHSRARAAPTRPPNGRTPRQPPATRAHAMSQQAINPARSPYASGNEQG
jgi:hypothetical protein